MSTPKISPEQLRLIASAMEKDSQGKETILDHHNVMLNDYVNGTSFRIKYEGNSAFSGLFRTGLPGNYTFVCIPFTRMALRCFLKRVIRSITNSLNGEPFDHISIPDTVTHNDVTFHRNGINVSLPERSHGYVSLRGVSLEKPSGSVMIDVDVTPASTNELLDAFPKDGTAGRLIALEYFEMLLAAVDHTV